MFCEACDIEMDDESWVEFDDITLCQACAANFIHSDDEEAPHIEPLPPAPPPPSLPSPYTTQAAIEQLYATAFPPNAGLVKKRRSLNTTAPDEEGTYNMPPLVSKEGFKFGCDPEAFVRDADGKHVSAALLLPGTKADPFPVEDGAVQVDGMAAEFNIDPVDNFEDWNKKIKNVIRQLEAMLPEGHTLDFSSSVVFNEDEFNTAPDIAKELGCSPDWNAWTGEVNPPPSDPENPYMRCAAGHIHLGWTEGETPDNLQHIMNCNDIVKQLDWYLGGWSTKMDTDPTRRRLYGRAGACRYKPYGVEYRVLSNFWVSSRDRRLAVWNRMQQAISDMRHVFVPDRASKSNANLIEMINSTSIDSDMAAMYRFPLRTIDPSYSRF
jgi:hypothetical protein